MTELLSKLSGGELAGFMLVLARVGPLFLIAPMYSSRSLPPRARGIAAVAIAIGLTPVAMQGQHLPGGAVALTGLVLEGMLTGFAFAFAIAVMFAAVETASAFLDYTSGFSFARMLNPQTNEETGAFSELYSIVGLLIFLAIGGDAWMLRGISRTFQLVPLTSAPHLRSVVGAAEAVFSNVFAASLEVAAPVLLALLVTDVAFGVVSKVVPQLNVFAVGFPVKIAVAVVLVAATLPFVAGWISEQLSLSVGSALNALHIA